MTNQQLAWTHYAKLPDGWMSFLLGFLTPVERDTGGRPAVSNEQVLQVWVSAQRDRVATRRWKLLFGVSYSTVRRRLHEWEQSGCWERAWRALLEEHANLDLRAVLIDGQIVKAPHGGDYGGPSPVDRAKTGTKRSLLTDAEGLPLGVVLAPANQPDSTLLGATLDASMVAVPAGTPLLADKGYRGRPARTAAAQRGCELHVVRKFRGTARGRIEHTFSFLNRLAGAAQPQFRSRLMMSAVIITALIILTLQHIARTF